MPAQQTVVIDGHRLRLTNLDKVLYPETGMTKAEVIAYYTEIAPVMLPHVVGRPLTRKRWPNGVGAEDAPGEMFFQKDLGEGVPDWVTRCSIEHSSGAKTYPIIADRATLAWLGQVAALELHVPQWRMGTDGRPLNPDRLVLDLDPGTGAGLADCVEVAAYARQILEGMGLDPVPVTSGSKGIHLYAHVDGSYSSDQISDLAHELARALEADHPDLVVSDMKKTLRRGKVLVDWSQNNANKTTIAPYSLRGRAHPTVAAPREWEELEDPDLRHLTYREVLERVKEIGDPMAALGVGAGSGRDRLEVYRAKRDASKTPEPVPERLPPVTDERVFVIQEHHARRLHWDLRLSHEGVLASWALPKGVPTTKERNNLAVQTEDHPMEYLTFHGTIPAGEYGAGEMTIWDHGTYELEKWHEGKEVIVTLTGQPDGGLAGPNGPGRTCRVALIHTGGDGRDDNQWLIHLMDPPGGGARATAARPTPRAELDADSATHRPPRLSSASASAPATRQASPERRAQRERTGGGRERTGESEASRASTRSLTDYRPMLATPGTVADVDDRHDWALEMKWDGIRAIVVVDGDDVRLISRSGQDMTATYPDLADVPGAVRVPSAVLDGEIVALDSTGRPSFAQLQQRMNLTRPRDIGRAAAEVPVHLIVFDVLEADGTAWIEQTYDERRDALGVVVEPGARVQVSPAFDGDVEAAMAASLEARLEGIMAKRRDSRYTPGRRSSMWIKIKHTFTQEAVVIGWRPGQGARAGAMGSLLLAVPGEGGQLRYAGRVGTGFSEKETVALVPRLERIEREAAPVGDVPTLDARGARWVEPQLVGEVEASEWTPDGRLRHPRWRGWRPDKGVDDLARPRQ